MKDIFEITFGEEDTPLLCVGEDIEDALANAYQRAEQLGLGTTNKPKVRFEGRYKDFEDFNSRYTLLNNLHDSMAALDGKVFGWRDIEWEAVSTTTPNRVWTLIENEDLWWISPGIHYVNRLGYLLTREARRFAESDYLYD